MRTTIADPVIKCLDELNEEISAMLHTLSNLDQATQGESSKSEEINKSHLESIAEIVSDKITKCEHKIFFGCVLT